MISIRNLFKSYRLGKETIDVLHNVNLNIEDGEFLCILGTSGCGKSTLLNIIGGLDRDVSGEILFDEKDTKGFSSKEWTSYRKDKIGFVFQSYNLIEHMTAQENVELAMMFNGCRENEFKERASELLDMVGLSDRKTFLPSQLSGGQKQRVAIARALANSPSMILADEPTGALDTKSSDEVMEILHKINRENGVTVVLVTHNKELAKEASRVVTMKDGQIENIIDVEQEKRHKAQNTRKISGKGKMSFLSALHVGIKNIWLRKKRSILTVVGSSIGIAGVVLMIGIGIGVDYKVHRELRSFVGDETIWVTNEDEKQPIEQSDVDKLKQIQGVDTILDNDLFTAGYYYNGKNVEGQLDAFGPKEIATDFEKELAAKGTVPEADDSYEIVLTSDIAEKLLGKDKDTEKLLGKEITVASRLILAHMLTYQIESKFTVVGISDSGLIAGPSFIPYKTAQKLAEESCKTQPAVQKGAEIRVNSKDRYDQVVKDIRKLGYKVTTNKEDFANINMIILGVKLFLVFIAAIALLVSSIMIKIVLKTSVIERTKEIGIVAAIGAGKKDIKRIFVAEAASLGFMSGVAGLAIGITLGVILNQFVQRALEFNLFRINVLSIVLSILISILIATFAGLKPAKKATKITPADVLRYE